MQEKYFKVWKEIEDGLGFCCCLHRRAAFLEVTGAPFDKLMIATTAPKDTIVDFLGKREVSTKYTDRFDFKYNDVDVELTTFCDTEDLDEIYQKAYRQTLTVDSIALSTNGRFTNAYKGLEDIRDKVLRLTDDSAPISEGLYRKMMLMHVNDGYSFDKKLSARLESDKIFKKEGYRIKFCELFVSRIRQKNVDWNQVARFLDIPGCTLDHKTAFISFTRGITNDMADEHFKRTYIFMIMSLLKMTSKELGAALKDVPEIRYFDSLCANLTRLIESHNDLTRVKNKYGEEFLQLLYDVQELWLKDVEGHAFRRYSERDFDKMGLIIAQNGLWFDRDKMFDLDSPQREEESIESAETVESSETVNDHEADEDVEMVGSPSFSKIMNSGFSDEYEEVEETEETEGFIKDDYEITPGDDVVKSKYEGDDFSFDDTPNVMPKDDKSSMGFNASGLDEYEMGTPSQRETTPTPKKSEGIMNNFRGHKSRVLNGGS